jgi:excisionase family DNA binding protein
MVERSKGRARYRLNPPPELRELLSSAQAAGLMGVSPTTFYKLVSEGEVVCRADLGRSHLFARDDVLEARRRLYGD